MTLCFECDLQTENILLYLHRGFPGKVRLDSLVNPLISRLKNPKIVFNNLLTHLQTALSKNVQT